VTPAVDPRSSLNAVRRAADLEALAGGLEVDVVVVGGGITGAGAALDAASRGLSVALLERRDLAHGTSRWSSKLVHGGLRYLESGDVGEVAPLEQRDAQPARGCVERHARADDPAADHEDVNRRALGGQRLEIGGAAGGVQR